MPNLSAAAAARARRVRVRMTKAEQLIEVARGLFAERGLDGTSVEEIAAHAEVSKPVVYEHFGGKEGLYAVVVDREVRRLHSAIRAALTTPRAGARRLIELGTLALLDYIDACPDGFAIISRGSTASSSEGSFATILSDVASRAEDLLAGEFAKSHFATPLAPMYAQMLVGLVALTGQWWLDTRESSPLDKEVVAAHVVNLAWNGMRHLEIAPVLARPRPVAVRPDSPEASA